MGQRRISAIGSDELPVFTPLETMQIAALDAIVPTRRISRRESVGSAGELGQRSRSGLARTDTLREETDGDNESPLFNSSSAHRSSFSWQPENEGLESKTEYSTVSEVSNLVLALSLIIPDCCSYGYSGDHERFRGLQDVAWYGAAFFMTTSGFQSAWGKIFKYFALKTGYLVTIGILQVGSILCAAAPTSMISIIGRAIAGVGTTGVSCGSYTIVAFIAEPKKRPAYTGILSAIFGIINLPGGVLPLVPIVFFFRTPEAAQPQDATLREKLLQLDPAGTSLLMGAIVAYLMGIRGSDAITSGVQNLPLVVSTMTGAVGAGLFISATGQVNVEEVDLSSTTALLLCFQTVGAAFVVSAAQAMFVNRMILAVPALVPGGGAHAGGGHRHGAAAQRVHGEELPGVLAAYLTGI
ncbi:hypothetical protein DL767_001483 [Monosporascus sp. MG133]|nr:hypothetical protein DL767_001483 [Monosporascus sp. MG133]